MRRQLVVPPAGQCCVILLLAGVSAGSAGEEITVELPGGATMEFVWIKSGMFLMGAPESERGRTHNELPQHEVTISRGFYLGKYELTQGQWEKVMGTRPWEGHGFVQSNVNHPVVGISWEDMQGLIAQLNETTGDSLYRLPTEAEWEYACRAGTTTRWSFGDDVGQLGEYAWYSWKNLGTTYGELYAQPVGMKKPNPWGLYDMHGNVYESCQDWYGDYSSDSQVDPTGPATGSYRIERGGDFSMFANSTRSAARSHSWPLDGSGFLGMRLLRMEPQRTATAPESWGEIKADR